MEWDGNKRLLSSQTENTSWFEAGIPVAEFVRIPGFCRDQTLTNWLRCGEGALWC
jgi:hypothetical protein